jgi:capsid protein
MVHFFVPIRPGQARGIPWMAPALTAFAFAARWKQATVLAAEHAANQALVWYSEDDDGRDPDSEWAGDEIETAAGVQVTAARGWKPMQVDAKHPNAQFEMLRRAMYGDAGRWAAMPHNMVLLDSADHNYASGRLDAQPFYRANLRRRAWLESIGLNHWFARWYSEARRARPWGRQAPVEPPEIRWDWPGYRHVDPLKEASAQSIRLRSGTTNLTTECAEEGHDAMEILATRARELAEIQRLANEYGLSPQMVDLLATGQASTSAEGGTQHGPADSNIEDDE